MIYIYIYNKYMYIYIYATPPPKIYPFCFLLLFLLLQKALEDKRKKKQRPWHGGKENRSFCKYSGQTILRGKVCQRLDLEGTDLVRTSTRTTLEVRSKK